MLKQELYIRGRRIFFRFLISSHMRDAVVEWLEQLGYGTESRCIA